MVPHITKTILVPLDGSALAEQILPYVRLLAPLLGAQVHLLRGISRAEYDRMFAPAHGVAVERSDRAVIPPICAACTMAAVCQGTDCAIAADAARLRAAGVEAYADTRVGAPSTVIAATADQWPDTLIAMATHGRSGLRRWALGSVADTLLHNTSIPLFLVRGGRRAPPPDPAIRRILVPLDGSALARQALPLAIDLAIRARAELILAQVAAPSLDEFMRAFPVAADVRQQLYEQADQALAVLADDIRQQPLRLSTAITLGPAAQAIADEAAYRRADLIVMATHGYTGLRRWRLGSVADMVLHATTTPLLLMRAHANEG